MGLVRIVAVLGVEKRVGVVLVGDKVDVVEPRRLAGSLDARGDWHRDVEPAPPSRTRGLPLLLLLLRIWRRVRFGGGGDGSRSRAVRGRGRFVRQERGGDSSGWGRLPSRGAVRLAHDLGEERRRGGHGATQETIGRKRATNKTTETKRERARRPSYARTLFRIPEAVPGGVRGELFFCFLDCVVFAWSIILIQVERAGWECVRMHGLDNPPP